MKKTLCESFFNSCKYISIVFNETGSGFTLSELILSKLKTGLGPKAFGSLPERSPPLVATVDDMSLLYKILVVELLAVASLLGHLLVYTVCEDFA